MRQLAEQLRAAGVPCFPCWSRYNNKKGKWDKGPAVPKGEAWQFTAYRNINDPQLNWSSNINGIPIPKGVLVVDLDGYKGASRQAIDEQLDCQLPWDDAFIQTTISGGEHYAFRCDWDVRQGDSINGLQGFDTRVAGKGFICAGEGYTPVNNGGVLAFGDISTLPTIPEEARAVLERKEEAAPAPVIRDTDAVDTSEVMEALKHVDPSCSRTEWRNIGYALKSMYAHDDAQGMAIFETWSCGDLWDGEVPENYVASGQGSPAQQWPTFKAEGGVNPSTLFYHAIQGGWKPPARFDAATAFGDNALGSDKFNELVEAIRQDGADIKQTPSLVNAIQTAGCNALQVALLAAELKTELNGVGLKDKSVTKHIDSLLQTRSDADHMVSQPGAYGKNDTDNAAIFLEKHYPNNTLARCDGLFYRYDGKCWQSVTPDTLKHQVYTDMAAQRMQESKMSTTARMVSNLASVRDGALNLIPENLIVFDNGILDLNTGMLGPHSPQLFTSNLIPYDWNPSAMAPGWVTFLNDIFDGDQECIQLLQEWMGYLMTRSYTHQKMMLMLGPPRCGKGTIGRILAALVGEQNFAGGSLSSLVNDSYLDSISEVPVVFVGDVEKRIANGRGSQVVERLKTISGNDQVSWHRMYHGGISRALPSRFTIAGNNIPHLFDDSGALAARLLILPFNKSYLGKEDLTLGDRLMSEIEGIAVWAYHGLVSLNRNGRFIEPEASRLEAEFISESYSPLKEFINEHIVIGEGERVSSRELCDIYRAWAISKGDEPMRPRTFVSALKDSVRGHNVRYDNHRFGEVKCRGFVGIGLNNQAVTAVGQALQLKEVK